MVSLFNRILFSFKLSIILQRSIYRQRNWNDASSVFMKSRACSCPWLSSTSCSLGTNQKLHTFCSKSNFTLRLKISNFLEIYSFSAFSGNKRKWQLLVVQDKANFLGWGENFLSTLFLSSFLYIIRGKVLRQKLLSTWHHFCERVVFPTQVAIVSFWKGVIFG